MKSNNNHCHHCYVSLIDATCRHKLRILIEVLAFATRRDQKKENQKNFQKMINVVDIVIFVVVDLVIVVVVVVAVIVVVVAVIVVVVAATVVVAVIVVVIVAAEVVVAVVVQVSDGDVINVGGSGRVF